MDKFIGIMSECVECGAWIDDAYAEYEGETWYYNCPNGHENSHFDDGIDYDAAHDWE